jgi:1-aminocyclopropane-1-carboxylate deaminase/D-cysteine desulfhydrase-like pyridoxal-dependent ACC family enzyme
MLEIVRDPYALTPVENINGMWVKREDLFAPFGLGEVNGGKLRQCWMMLDKIKDEYSGTITCCSIHSPQGPISAAVSKHFGLISDVYYGRVKPEMLEKADMVRLVKHYGGNPSIHPNHIRQVNLYYLAKQNAPKENKFIIAYGFNLSKYPEAILDAVSNQVKNIPDELDNLIITCGSGITSTGVLIGIKKFNKHVKKIYFVATAPSREKSIQKTIEENDLDIEYEIIDLFHRKGFEYTKGAYAKLGDIELHPNYEAKTYRWLVNESSINRTNNKTLFWIVGSLPKLKYGE